MCILQHAEVMRRLCPSQGETADSFNWGALRPSVDSLEKDPVATQQENELLENPAHCLGQTIHQDSDSESSEEETLTASQILAHSQIVSSF